MKASMDSLWGSVFPAGAKTLMSGGAGVDHRPAGSGCFVTHTQVLPRATPDTQSSGRIIGARTWPDNRGYDS